MIHVRPVFKAKIGFNPFIEPPPPPKKKVFGLKQRELPTEAQLAAKNERLKVWMDYLEHRDDMSTVWFAMGPDFKQVSK